MCTYRSPLVHHSADDCRGSAQGARKGSEDCGTGKHHQRCCSETGSACEPVTLSCSSFHALVLSEDQNVPVGCAMAEGCSFCGYIARGRAVFGDSSCQQPFEDFL